VDLISCHLKILADLNLGPLGQLETGVNVWKQMVGALLLAHQQEFDFKLLKASAKRLSYKCLQGGRVDTVEKIHRTLINEEKLARKRLLKLAEHFGTNELLKECDRLNFEIMERDLRLSKLKLYTPMDA
jgi:DNA polymerase III epsilon subunit-like protein